MGMVWPGLGQQRARLGVAWSVRGRVRARSAGETPHLELGPVVNVNACSIKGNVKKNISPSTGSGETFLDFQTLSALCEALGSVLLPCGLWGLTLFHLSSFIFVSSDDADQVLKLASRVVVRCGNHGSI